MDFPCAVYCIFKDEKNQLLVSCLWLNLVSCYYKFVNNSNSLATDFKKSTRSHRLSLLKAIKRHAIYVLSHISFCIFSMKALFFLFKFDFAIIAILPCYLRRLTDFLFLNHTLPCFSLKITFRKHLVKLDSL